MNPFPVDVAESFVLPIGISISPACMRDNLHGLAKRHQGLPLNLPKRGCQFVVRKRRKGSNLPQSLPELPVSAICPPGSISSLNSADLQQHAATKCQRLLRAIGTSCAISPSSVAISRTYLCLPNRTKFGRLHVLARGRIEAMRPFRQARYLDIRC